MNMNRDLIVMIVVFGLLAMIVGVSNSINVPRRPETALLPPEPVAGDIDIDLLTEQGGKDAMLWRIRVNLHNVAGHPLLLRSPNFKARILLVAGSSETSMEEHSLERSGNLIWKKDDVHWYGIMVWLKPSAANQTRDFYLTAHYGTASATYPGAFTFTGIRTHYELDKMTVSDDTD